MTSGTDNDTAGELEQRIRAAIPLAEAMQFHIETLAPGAIRVSAPLAPNINIHGTGFAGSIYSLAVLTGWALCTHLLDSAGVAAELVVARAEIKYRAPVNDRLECRTAAEAAQRERFIADVTDSGKAVMALEIPVGSAPSAILTATYCALSKKNEAKDDSE